MARAPVSRLAQPIEFNKFIAGLVTDASPLTPVANSSLDEDNYVLNIDGSRRRRLGMDYEIDFVKQPTSIIGNTAENIATTSFRWKNAGGLPNKTLSVIQIGNEIKVYDLSVRPISGSLLYTYMFAAAEVSQNFSYAVVDGILVVASGTKTTNNFSFEEPNIITRTETTLYVRDFFGVEDKSGGINFYEGLNVQKRASGFRNEHLYNLRNQTWGIPRVLGISTGTTTPAASDPVIDFINYSGGPYPSNADNVNEALYPDNNNASNRTIDRFFVEDLFKNPLGTTRAASGYFIIDALERGASRVQNDFTNKVLYPALNGFGSPILPLDKTPGGATVIAEFAGRVFYGGFSGEVIDGDELSPRLSSYILFSKTVDNVSDVGKCYQEGDPTSTNSPDLIDTDGGFLRVNGAYGIQALVNVGTSLIVIASNGVWRIIGGNDYGFSATNFLIEKISDHGITSSDSVVLVDNTIMFWGSDAIYHVHMDQYGGWVCENISFGRIQKLYDSIPFEDRLNARGSYDTFDRKVRWLFYNRVTDSKPTRELILDASLKAYYTASIKQLTETVPRVVGYFTGDPYTVSFDNEVVEVLGDTVTVNGVDVTISLSTKITSTTREIGYVVLTQVVPTIEYTFAVYRDGNFIDWISEDGVGVDAAAYAITTYIGNDDYQRGKMVPYLHVHLNRTETGFIQVGDDLVPTGQSSCMVQARWDWSDSSNSNKWGIPFQAYKYKHMFFPSGVSDTYDTGFSTIVTRSRLRGSGKVLSLKFSTSPGKDCHIYGWGMIMSMAGNV